MRLSALAVCLISLLVMTSAAHCQDLYMSGPQQPELTEGQPYEMDWSAGGAETVDIYVSGQRIQMRGQSRGAFEVLVAKGVPAVQGSYSLTVPSVDSTKLTITIIGRDGSGKKVSAGHHDYRYRPSVMASRLDDGIYVDLHRKINQRLYVQNSGVITKAYICSSSEAYHWLPMNVHPKDPHDHAGVFKVLDKAELIHSHQFDVDMPWALHYLSGHYIHATSPNFYRLLGQPASHGCIRLSREDAHALFDATSVGTRVEVIGSESQ